MGIHITILTKLLHDKVGRFTNIKLKKNTYPLSTSQCKIPAVTPFVVEKTLKRLSGWTGRGSYLPSTPAAVSIMTLPSLYAQTLRHHQ